MVKTEFVEYENYGKCLSMTNGEMELLVTLDIGPRVIKCNLTGMNNIMFNDIDRKISADVSELYGDGKVWYIYGGHRLWTSPESMPHTYYPDNEKVSCELNGNTAVLTPPLQKVTGLQYRIEITMDNSLPEVSVVHKIVNNGDNTAEFAAWALTVMAGGGVAICPQPTHDTGLLGNRLIALWPYTKLTDSRLILSDKYIAVTHDAGISKKLKFGINNEEKWVAYVVYGQVFKKTFEPNHPCGLYPDGGMSTEVFANDSFVEIETLSELKPVESGGSVVHEERWSLAEAPAPEFSKSSPNVIEEYALKYIV